MKEIERKKKGEETEGAKDGEYEDGNMKKME